MTSLCSGELIPSCGYNSEIIIKRENRRMASYQLSAHLLPWSGQSWLAMRSESSPATPVLCVSECDHLQVSQPHPTSLFPLLMGKHPAPCVVSTKAGAERGSWHPLEPLPLLTDPAQSRWQIHSIFPPPFLFFAALTPSPLPLTQVCFLGPQSKSFGSACLRYSLMVSL